MRTLYESILDDDETVLHDTKLLVWYETVFSIIHNNIGRKYYYTRNHCNLFFDKNFTVLADGHCAEIDKLLNNNPFNYKFTKNLILDNIKQVKSQLKSKGINTTIKTHKINFDQFIEITIGDYSSDKCVIINAVITGPQAVYFVIQVPVAISKKYVNLLNLITIIK